MRKYSARKSAIQVDTSDGDLKVTIFPNGEIRVDSRRGTSFDIIDIDYGAGDAERAMAPIGATHRVRSYSVSVDGENSVRLNGDVYEVYLGAGGIIIDKSARERVRKLPVNEPKRRGDSTA